MNQAEFNQEELDIILNALDCLVVVTVQNAIKDFLDQQKDAINKKLSDFKDSNKNPNEVLEFIKQQEVEGLKYANIKKQMKSKERILIKSKIIQMQEEINRDKIKETAEG